MLRFGAPLAGFEAKDTGGRTWRSGDLRGKFTVIYLWSTAWARATDTIPEFAREGIADMPELVEVQRFFEKAQQAKKLQVLTFCKDYESGDTQRAEEYMQRKRYTFPVITDWAVRGRLFFDKGPVRQWVVDPQGRLSFPERAWSFGRLLFEVEKAAGG